MSSQEEKKHESDKKIRYLTMSSLDKEVIVVEESIAILSTTIKNLVEDGCASNVIPVQVDSKVMAKIIEYCSKHVGEETANQDQKKDLMEFDAKFAKELDQNMLYHLIIASNYLDIAGLLNLMAQTIADMLKGKKPDEIRAMLNIKNDFTPEEDEKIRNDNPWAFD